MVCTQVVWVKVFDKVFPEELGQETLYSTIRHLKINAWHCVPQTHYSIEVKVSCLITSCIVVCQSVVTA